MSTAQLFIHKLKQYMTIWTPAAITPNATNTIGQVRLGGIYINKAMTGTLVIRDGATVRGTIAAATVAGTYWTTEEGMGFANLVIVSNNAADDITVSLCSA